MSDTATTGPAAGQPADAAAATPDVQPPAPVVVTPPPPPAAAPVIDTDALAAALLPQLAGALLPQLAGLVKVPQAPAGQVPATATPKTWGDASATFTKGELVSHGYYSHVDGRDVVRYGIVVAVTAPSADTPALHTVAWLAETSDPVPATELRAV